MVLFSKLLLDSVGKTNRLLLRNSDPHCITIIVFYLSHNLDKHIFEGNYLHYLIRSFFYLYKSSCFKTRSSSWYAYNNNNYYILSINFTYPQQLLYPLQIHLIASIHLSLGLWTLSRVRIVLIYLWSLHSLTYHLETWRP